MKLKTNVTNIPQCLEDNVLCLGEKSKFKNPQILNIYIYIYKNDVNSKLGKNMHNVLFK